MKHAVILTAGLVIIMAAPATAQDQTAVPYTIIVTSLDSTSQVVFDYRLLPNARAWYLPTAEDMEQPDAMHGEGLTTPDTIKVWVINFSAAFYDVNETGNLHVQLRTAASWASAWGRDIMNVWRNGSQTGARELYAPPESEEDEQNTLPS